MYEKTSTVCIEVCYTSSNKAAHRGREASMGTVIYGEAEQAIQREMASMAVVLKAERARARKLLRRLRGLASYKVADAVGDDEIDFHVASVIAGTLEIAAGDLDENIRALRWSAKATPERLAAKVPA